MVGNIDVSRLTPEQRAQLRTQLFQRGEGNDPAERSFRSRLTGASATFKAAWRLLGNPFLGLLAVAFVLFFLVDAAVRADLYLAATRLLGSVFVILVACYTVFDHFLSFREFGKLLRKWERGEELTHDDRDMGRSMAIRSGLVFLSICILLASALHFIQPAVKSAMAGAGGP